jgi:CRISPR-associated endonuclease/helicase Cas3
LGGLWHDLGKYSAEFQRMIRGPDSADAHIEGKPGRVNHSSAGALWAVKRFADNGLDDLGRALAYIIAGHHAGLPDWHADRTGAAALSQRLNDRDLLGRALAGSPPRALLERPLDVEKPVGFDPAFWIRMLFSAVVDADFLDAEAFFDPARSATRSGWPALADLRVRFTTHMAAMQARAAATPVNQIRAEVFRQCIERVGARPGLFSLTVPTGGGKTLASLGFALAHAAAHGHRRVIYVIPYTSIIEQTADVFRGIFGEAVVEHQSNLDPDEPGRETAASRLACENWDAPVIVTTAVQFFESLFAARPSRCRRLHNIASSVVILDEAQLLPVEVLDPILHALRQLIRSYGVSVVLCTATQPALDPNPETRFEGLPDRLEIIADPAALHRRMRRVVVELPEDLTAGVTWSALAEELERHLTVLCIVDRRADARTLHSLMPPGTVHLSALMCGAHRARVLRSVRESLAAHDPVRVVSTQLVEAGVDLDFPVVYRALAGLDSLAQAAGRCNREGTSGRPGLVKVFVPPAPPPPGHLRRAAEVARRVLAVRDSDPLSPAAFVRFFRELYWLAGSGRDAYGVLGDLCPNGPLEFAFRSAAREFRMIRDEYQPVIVRFAESPALIAELRAHGPSRELLRRLQRYTVTMPRRSHGELVVRGDIEELSPGVFVQVRPGLYRDDVGFVAEGSLDPDPERWIV